MTSKSVTRVDLCEAVYRQDGSFAIKVFRHGRARVEGNHRQP